MNRPLGNRIAQLFLSFFSELDCQFRIVPCVMAVVQVDACIFGNELLNILGNDRAIGTAVRSCMEGFYETKKAYSFL